MTFTDAVRESMARFLSGELTLAEIQKTQEAPVKFTPDYLDELEEALQEMPEEEMDNEAEA